MRGEADTAILGEKATLEDNIELLRDVLKTQNELIRECVDEDVKRVPRMLALYKEVEAFFYGNDQTAGLMGSEELEDVILLLCDDNYGNLRTLPTKEIRADMGCTIIWTITAGPFPMNGSTVRTFRKSGNR